MSFSDQERTDIRRYCGYGMFGQQALPASGYRFSTQYGALEYKMTNVTATEESTVRTTLLANLYTLESDLYGSTGARQNLDTDQAAIWKHNANELKDRNRLYTSARKQLCNFLGISPGPGLTSDSNIQLIV